jgi:hypothetical protein
VALPVAEFSALAATPVAVAADVSAAASTMAASIVAAPLLAAPLS